MSNDGKVRDFHLWKSKWELIIYLVNIYSALYSQTNNALMRYLQSIKNFNFLSEVLQLYIFLLEKLQFHFCHFVYGMLISETNVVYF